MQPTYIAHTDPDWFANLSRLASGRPARLDEVNFWSPTANKPMKHFQQAEPVFLRLGKPTRKIVGYGFYAASHRPDVYTAWEMFAAKNGAPTLAALAILLGRATEESLLAPLQCTVLRDVVFWSDPRWIPWDEARGYANSGVQRGRTESDSINLAVLYSAMANDGMAPPRDLAGKFVPLDTDRRRLAEMRVAIREGQNSFRLRLLDAYGHACAVTGEHTEPVLQAAHIQPYLGPASNHVQNGLLLTSEFHTLFDRGLITVDPPAAPGAAYTLQVSRRIRERWNNGRRYNAFDGAPVSVPRETASAPSVAALAWHRTHVFERW